LFSSILPISLYTRKYKKSNELDFQHEALK
jgi:hypothetical protein